MLKEHKKRQSSECLETGPLYENIDLVFANSLGRPLNLTNLVKRHFKPILQKAGLSEAIRLYDLRHSCATLLLEAGENPKVVAERLGHASITLTHERMHRDIAFDIQGKIQGGLRETQIALDLWREEYNNIRPHEAIGMSTPASLYTKSERGYWGDIDEIIYPANFMTRRVSNNGSILINGTRIYINHTLVGYNVGLHAQKNKIFNLWLLEFLLGSIDLENYSFRTLTLDK